MNKPSKIQQIFLYSYEDFQSSDSYVSGVQEKAAHAILNCKSGSLGYNITSVLTVDTWNFTIIPAATATVPTVRQS